MIVVAGFNTAIDVQVDVAVLQPGEVQRSSAPRRMPGGKGLHVAQTIAALGEAVTLVGLVDHANRTRIEDLLHSRGVHFVGIDAEHVRECWAVREADGRMTEILQPGPTLEPAQVAALQDALLAHAAGRALVVLSGSLPPGAAPGLYAQLIEHLQSQGTRCLLDASGEALQLGLQAKPYSVKPNRDEIGQLHGGIHCVDDAVRALRQLQASGVQRPLLSLGGDGALLLGEDDVAWRGSVRVDPVVNPVGSGDCMVAGFAVALLRELPADQALRLAVACGAANAALEETGYVPPGVAARWLPDVQVRAVAA